MKKLTFNAFIEAAQRGNLGVLLCYEGDVNQPTEHSMTALLFASCNGHIDCVEALIQKGADVNYKNSVNNTALWFACVHGHIKCIEVLLQQGAYVDQVGFCNFTPLLNAANYKHMDCVKLLTQHGANVNLKDKEGKTAMDYLIMYGKNKYVKLLVENGADFRCNKWHPVSLAIAAKNKDCETYLRNVIKSRNTPWIPELTEYYPNQFKNTVETLILASGTYDTSYTPNPNTDIPIKQLPLELIFEICTHIATQYTI